ncbi:MAG: two-component system response regulator CreB [Deltaproteobacteria bacterium]|nr:two-component system response regulator CreB [Deltaproteobacteria bacterium]HCH65697.1 two-component system response regulator CreB [Deltaproteobacteria bacterium]
MQTSIDRSITDAEILIVDDDPRLREVVRYALSQAGFRVREAGDGRAALHAIEESLPDLVVLDVVMPEIDGVEVCRRIRQHSSVPVVFLSSKGEEVDRVLGLELGGDDYLSKPFSPRELVSRIKAVLRRVRPRSEAPKPPIEPEPSNAIRVGRVQMDVDRHRTTVDHEEINLTATEFRLLRVLLERPGVVFTRAKLVESAYPGNHYVSDRTLDSHIRRIRRKLRDVGLDPIETVHGVGFRYQES